MNYLDWLVVAVYITIIIGLAFYLLRKQEDIQDYYLAGKKIKWWQSGASTMATQLGAISFVSAPAFVAIKDGGGLKWLSYELGVPLALIIVMAVIIPVLHRHNYISIYEYLEDRFDSGTRTLVSLLFQLGRGLATAVSVLAGGLILSTALAIPTTTAIVLIGAITILYDVLGGIRVVILSDFLQMMIIAAGILICGGVAWYLVGWDGAWNSLGAERFKVLDFNHWGVSSEGEYAFWPMLIGGMILHISYYGCDQSQVQRELTVGSVNNVRKITTLFWGVFCVSAALAFASVGDATRQTTIVLINAVGSLLYGPILAAFLMGMLTKWVGPRALKVGVLAGIIVNLCLWIFTPISWLWWNLTGLVMAVTVALFLSLAEKRKLQLIVSTLIFSPEHEKRTSTNWPLVYRLVSFYFVLIVLVCYLIETSI